MCYQNNQASGRQGLTESSAFACKVSVPKRLSTSSSSIIATTRLKAPTLRVPRLPVRTSELQRVTPDSNDPHDRGLATLVALHDLCNGTALGQSFQLVSSKISFSTRKERNAGRPSCACECRGDGTDTCNMASPTRSWISKCRMTTTSCFVSA